MLGVDSSTGAALVGRVAGVARSIEMTLGIPSSLIVIVRDRL